MNGVHDMGGMHGLGPIQYEPNEPVFHAEWEGAGAGHGARDGRLAEMESRRVSPPDRADSSSGISAHELLRKMVHRCHRAFASKWSDRPRRARQAESPLAGSSKAVPALAPAQVPSMLRSGALASRAAHVAPRFHAGQTIRTRNINPPGHTRLPRYARAKRGTVERDHGVYVFPDTTAHFAGEKPQHVYSVRFTARELWGEQASSRDSVYLDLWDDYLEPA